MGSHARPRRRVRAAALGTLAVGATLTGVGLTAAALDPSGTSLADGTLSGDPVNFTASGLGAPVPVADVSSLDGSSLGNSVVVTKTGTDNGTSGAAMLGDPSGGYLGSGDYLASSKAVSTKAVGTRTSAKAAGTKAVSQGASTVAADSVPSKTGTASGSTATSSSSGAGSSTGVGSGGSSGASTTPAAQIPSLDASLPISTALPVPSLPTIASLSTAVSHAKSTVAGLLNEVARLV